MTYYVIEKNIPLPEAGWKPGKTIQQHLERFPFEDMKIGDSFVVPPLEANMIRGVVNTYERLEGQHCQFTVRACINGARVWRVR